MNWKEELSRLDAKLDALTEAVVCEREVQRRERLQKQVELGLKCRSFVTRKVIETWVWTKTKRRPCR